MKLPIFKSNMLTVLLCTSGLLAHNTENHHHNNEHIHTQENVNNYTHIECTIIPKEQLETHISHPHIPGPRTSRVPAGQVSSTNWSGYAAATNLNHPTKNSVSAVSGSWIVPTIVSSGGNTYSSLWVGIDGYNSPTVEQIGTEHDFSGGVQQHYAWFEMYPGGSYVINGFPLKPGDVISASVVYSGNNIFTMTLMNDTQKVSYTVPTQYTKSSTALRESAEWIVEAPYYNGILPLSNFATAYLWGCMATINGITAPIGNNSWQNVGIEMTTTNGTPKDLTSPLLPDKGSFFVTWKHQ
jgi:Peptidase A4 family